MLPQRDTHGRVWIVLGIATAILAISSCLSLFREATAGDRGPVVQDAAQETIAATERPSAAGLYQLKPEPLLPLQCGQCHTDIYLELKNNGGRHRFQCQHCHKRLHEYNPVRKNWQELMPTCKECHTLPHGERFAQCTSCHGTPHAAARKPDMKMLTGSCTTCHTSPYEQLQKFPSAHTEVPCSTCHVTHGFIPNCATCHKPHYEGQSFTTCASACHPVHMPTKVNYKKDIAARNCSGCHQSAFTAWRTTPSEHADVNCAACHGRHGHIPACSDCHAGPHSKRLHDKFPKCLTCHQDPHDPPVKQRSRKMTPPLQPEGP